MSNYFLTDSGNRLIKDDTFAFIADPCQIFRDTGIPVEYLNVIERDAAPPPLERLAEISSPRPNGFRLDPSGFFFSTDAGDRIVPEAGAASPMERVQSSFVDSVIPPAVLGTVARDVPSGIEFRAPIFVDQAGIAMERLVDVINLQAIALERLLLFDTDFHVPADWFSNLQFDTAGFTIEFKGALAADSSIPDETTGDVKVSSVAVVERLGSVLSDRKLPVEKAGAAAGTGAANSEHLTDVPVTTPIEAENTLDVSVRSPGLIERLAGRVADGAFPDAPLGTVARDTVVLIDHEGGVYIDTSHDAPVEFRGAVSSFSIALPDRLGSVADRRPTPAEWRGSMLRDTASPMESTVQVTVRTDLLVERLIGVAHLERLPTAWAGLLQRDSASPVDFRAAIAAILDASLEELAGLRQDRPVPEEHLSTVQGLTPARMAYSSTVAADSRIPADILAGVAQVAAAQLEHLTDVKVNSGGPAAWSGTVVTEFVIRDEALAKLVTDKPALIEITIDVHRDSASPINFHGFAFVQGPGLIGTDDTPTLIGTDETINLAGEQAQILLIGEVGD